VRWLLVGDDGQHDEERYREFEESHPDSVAAVAIRELTPGEAVLAGGRSQREEHGSAVPWVYGVDGAELADSLTELGLLSTPRA
jgi:phosphatidate phosphatase APP1